MSGEFGPSKRPKGSSLKIGKPRKGDWSVKSGRVGPGAAPDEPEGKESTMLQQGLERAARRC